METPLAAALMAAALAAASPDDVLKAGRDVPRPERVHHIPATYPDRLRGATPAVMGLVIMDVVLDEEGRPVDIKLLRGQPLLDQVALEAVRQWRYRPTVVDGSPRRVSLIEVVGLFPSDTSRDRFLADVLNDPKAHRTNRLIALELIRDAGPAGKEVRKALEKAAEDPDPDIRGVARALLHAGPTPKP